MPGEAQHACGRSLSLRRPDQWPNRRRCGGTGDRTRLTAAPLPPTPCARERGLQPSPFAYRPGPPMGSAPSVPSPGVPTPNAPATPASPPPPYIPSRRSQGKMELANVETEVPVVPGFPPRNLPPPVAQPAAEAVKPAPAGFPTAPVVPGTPKPFVPGAGRAPGSASPFVPRASRRGSGRPGPAPPPFVPSRRPGQQPPKDHCSGAARPQLAVATCNLVSSRKGRLPASDAVPGRPGQRLCRSAGESRGGSVARLYGYRPL